MEITNYTVPLIILVIWIHWFTDFFLQSDKMGINKSSSNMWLLYHCLVYSLPFLVLLNIGFVVVTFILHFMGDFYSSRITTKLFLEKKRHWFFVTIGFDQAYHLSCLILCMQYFEIIPRG